MCFGLKSIIYTEASSSSKIRRCFRGHIISGLRFSQQNEDFCYFDWDSSHSGKYLPFKLLNLFLFSSFGEKNIQHSPRSLGNRQICPIKKLIRILSKCSDAFRILSKTRSNSQGDPSRRLSGRGQDARKFA